MVRRKLVEQTLDLIKHIDLKTAKNGELSPLQIRTLVFVKQKECVKPSLLAKEFNVTPATITAQIDKLVENKWLDRCYDEDDRRVVNISLTEKAVKEVDTLIDQTLRRYEWISTPLTKKEQEQLLMLITKIHEYAHSSQVSQK